VQAKSSIDAIDSAQGRILMQVFRDNEPPLSKVNTLYYSSNLLNWNSYNFLEHGGLNIGCIFCFYVVQNGAMERGGIFEIKNKRQRVWGSDCSPVE
jgi:hypothetical protein